MEHTTPKEIKGLTFSVYSPEEVYKLSVLEITNAEILDILGNPSPGGLHDLRLGPNERDEVCSTCHLDSMRCAGHPGHITLPVCAYNPVFFQQLYQLLRGSCFNCHRLLAPRLALQLALHQLQALDYGLVGLVQDLAEVLTDVSTESTSTEDHFYHVQAKLEMKFNDAIQGLTSTERSAPVKSVVECRRNVVKQFVKNHMMNAPRKCFHCHGTIQKIIKYNMRLVYKDTKKPIGAEVTNGVRAADVSELTNKELSPEDARKHLRLLWENDNVFLRHFYKPLGTTTDPFPTDMFFISLLIVPPSKFRRMNVMKGKKYANDQTTIFNEVLKDCSMINKVLRKIAQEDISEAEKDIVSRLPGRTDGEKYSQAYHQLQKHINEIFDSDTNNDKTKTSTGIKQILEKKEGLFRMNMMGKRVNFAARSVISSDPYIHVDEIGLPLVFARKLTFPEPVNHWNVETLRKALINGPNVHPGATLVELEDGRRVMLTDPDRRRAMANTLLTPSLNRPGAVKVVHRHVRDGDMLLLNRQPTLHKPSIMAHRARVLPGEKTLRLHYANCKSYNADFDGDEMNAHLPQSYAGQSECRHIVGVNHQYLVPKDGTPLSGLIQDHIIAGVLITLRGRFFEREQYQQLIYSAMSFHRKRLKLLPPSILKPCFLWSGKQIVSTLLINLIPEGKTPPTIEGKAKVSSKNWRRAPSRDWLAGGTPLPGDSMTESEVVIRQGELLCGVIDKAHVGPTPYGLMHFCYELYGGTTSSVLLTALARLFTHYLQYYSGFSLGIEDIVVEKKPNRQRRKVLRSGDERGLLHTAKALEVSDLDAPDRQELLFKYKETHFSRDDFGLKMLDMEMKNVTHALNNEINEVCIPSGLRKKFPDNSLQLMIESGAKGSSVNAMQISCLLGQIELEGRRMPLMLNGSTLPSFPPYSSSPGAGGFVGGRFLTGVNPQEYFFHCMAGREGLIDTAVKTSRSGYLQRCLIKHLESIAVHYDLTVRDGDGTILQFLYGEDGLDPLKMQMLKPNRLHLLGNNYTSAIHPEHLHMLQQRTAPQLEHYKKKVRKWKKHHEAESFCRKSPVESVEYKPLNTRDRLRKLQSIMSSQNFIETRSKCPLPANSLYRPDLHLGSVSEKMESLIGGYISQRHKMSRDSLRDLYHFRSLRALVEPGEMVGLLAAQSIGEPSTQMTLNTFHFAGKGEMNVTLGIPRIREILMTASANIATPTMDLPLREDCHHQGHDVKLKLSPVALKDMLDHVKIREFITIGDNGINLRNYTLRMRFLKHSEYRGHVNTTPNKILVFIEKIFIKKFIDALKKKMRISSSARVIDIVRERDMTTGADDEDVDDPPEPKRGKVEEGESSAESEGEGDTTSTKQKQRHDQDQGYEEPEEEDIIPESDDEASADEEAHIKVESEEEEAVSPRFFISDEDKGKRSNEVKCIHGWISNYSFDTKSQRWCEISFEIPLNVIKIDMKSLLEEEIAKANIYSVPHIKEAILIKDSPGNPLIKTNGVNFLEVFKYEDILDINRVYSNNIHEISKIYGIEAAARTIRKEIVGVFAAYGIEVDPRHLSLVSDYMTCSGQYRPCSRLGMEGNASPLQQMTFETTKNFLIDSMLNGVEERMVSPSANVIMGQLYRGGTGCFDLRMKKCAK